MEKLRNFTFWTLAVTGLVVSIIWYGKSQSLDSVVAIIGAQTAVVILLYSDAKKYITEHNLKYTTQTSGMQCRTTFVDGDLAIDQTVKEKPVGGIRVFGNTTRVSVGDGVKTESAYFSGDGGITARYLDKVQVGDKLYWNESIAGYQLDGGDYMFFDYLTVTSS